MVNFPAPSRRRWALLRLPQTRRRECPSTTSLASPAARGGARRAASNAGPGLARRRAKGYAARDGPAEVGRAVGPPPEALRPRRPPAVRVLARLLAVVDDPVLPAVRRLEEAVVPGAVDRPVRARIPAEDRAGRFPPGLRVRHLAAGVRQHPERVVGGPRVARRVDEEEAPGAPQHYGALVDGVAHPLPVVIGLRDQTALARHRPGVAQRRDADAVTVAGDV